MTRRIYATVALLIILALAIVVAVRPEVKQDRLGVYAVSALIAALVFGGRALWRRPGISYAAVVLAGLGMAPFVVIARGFGRVDMMALLFHTDFGMQGAGLSGLRTEIITASVVLLLILLAVAGLGNLWRMGRGFYLGAAALLVLANPLAQYGLGALVHTQIKSDLARRLMPPTLTADTPSPDLVVIYLEGLDRRFADRQVFGDAYDTLDTLQRKGLSFTNIGQIAGTGWSLAGMIATQCGVPLLPRGLLGRNNFDGVENFLPSLTCLGDVLAARGYANEYIVGGDLGFAGIDTFYSGHGFQTLIGLHEQQALYSAEDFAAASIDWILDDQMVFDTARTRLPALMQGAAPFAMVVETIGPHGREGYLSRKCSPSGRGEKTRDTDAVLRCTAQDAYDFTRHLQRLHEQQRRGRDLRVVILSDHLSHNGATPPVAHELAGANTVIFLGGDTAGQINDRPGSMIDVYPTLLEWLGFATSPVAAGLGRSLLSPPKTLVEQHGIPLIDGMLAGDAELGAALWK